MAGPAVRIASLLKAKPEHVATIGPDATVRDVLAGLAQHGIGALIVSEDGRAIDGIVSERDIVRHLHQRGPDLLDAAVASIMTREVRTCGPDDTVDGLMELMTEQRIRHVPVVVDGSLTGIVSIGDVVKSRLGELAHENSVLHEYITTGR
jgi:CBS domain-containing protein